MISWDGGGIKGGWGGKLRVAPLYASWGTGALPLLCFVLCGYAPYYLSQPSTVDPQRVDKRGLWRQCHSSHDGDNTSATTWILVATDMGGSSFSYWQPTRLARIEGHWKQRDPLSIWSF